MNNKNTNKHSFLSNINKIRRFRFWNFAYGDNRKKTTKNVLVAFFSIVISLLIALFITMIIYGQGSLFYQIIAEIFRAPFSGSFVKATIGSIAIFAVSALSFIFAQKVGLFNIGISGQMLFAGQIATIVGFALSQANVPIGLGQIVVIIMAMMSGAVISSIIGALKTYLNINEVITSILFNWIIYFAGTYMIQVAATNGGYMADTGLTTSLLPANVSLNIFQGNGSAINGYWLPLLVIMLVAIPVSVLIINYSTFGKKVSTTGLSTSASTYAGINIQKKRMIAMIISGLLAGLLGAMIYCGQTNQVFVTISAKTIPSEGFNGISVGLIAMTNPIGVLPISLFFAMVDNAKATIQSAHSVDPAIADLMFGVVVYGAAVISLIYYFKPWIWLRKIVDGKKNEAEYRSYSHHLTNKLEESWGAIYFTFDIYRINKQITKLNRKLDKYHQDKFAKNEYFVDYVNSFSEIFDKYAVNKVLPKHLEKSFHRELSELNSKYRDKLNVHEATKYLLSLEKLSKLYNDKQRLYNSLDIQTTFEKYRIDINKLSNKKYRNQCIGKIMDICNDSILLIKYNYRSTITVNKLYSFDIKMIKQRLKKFYKYSTVEVKKDYLIQKNEISKMPSLQERQVELAKLICNYELAISELKSEMHFRTKLAETSYRDENEISVLFTKYREDAYQVYYKYLEKNQEISKRNHLPKVIPYDKVCSQTSNLSRELISKEMRVAKEYGMDLNYVTKIQQYKDKTAYKLASIEIQRQSLNAILDKKIEQIDIKGGGF